MSPNNRSKREWLRLGGLILGLIGAVGFTLFFLGFMLSWYSSWRDVDPMEWLQFVVIGLFFFGSVVAARKWSLIGSILLILEGLPIIVWLLYLMVIQHRQLDPKPLVPLLASMSFLASATFFILSWREGRKQKG